MTITGCGFTGATAVHFGTAAATGVVVNSDTSVTAHSPAHAAGTVDVTVTTPGGTSATSTADHFTFAIVPCTSVTETAAPPSSGPVSSSPSGVPVTFTAIASGCPNPSYQFWLLAPGSTTWMIEQAYSTTATFTWDTTGFVAGAYKYTVWARDASSTGTQSNNLGSFDAAFPVATYTLTTVACTSVTETAAPPSPQPVGTTITFSAVAATCPHPLYQFWLLGPGSTTWSVAQSYSTSATFVGNTSGSPAGVYHYTVWARDSGSAGTQSNNLGSFDAAFPVAAYTLTSTATPCTSVTDTAAPPATAASGTTVTFTALASGCPTPSYQFWILAPGSTTWMIGQPYSTLASFNWNTTGLAAGVYRYTVWARDASSTGTQSNNLGSFDAAFTVANYTLTSTPCTSVTESASPPSTAASGTTVTFTALASGCPTPRYQFWILAPGSTTWMIGQAYSPTATFSWNTTGLVAGVYRYTVWARDASSTGTNSNNLGSFDTFFAATNYTLTSTPCTSVTETAAPPTTATSGTSVTFSAVASGCTHPLYQFWVLAPGSTTWTVVQAYSTNASFVWNTTGKAPGVYHFTVWAKDSGSPGTQSNNLGSFDAAFPVAAYTLT